MRSQAWQDFRAVLPWVVLAQVIVSYGVKRLAEPLRVETRKLSAASKDLAAQLRGSLARPTHLAPSIRDEDDGWSRPFVTGKLATRNREERIGYALLGL